MGKSRLSFFKRKIKSAFPPSTGNLIIYLFFIPVEPVFLLSLQTIKADKKIMAVHVV